MQEKQARELNDAAHKEVQATRGIMHIFTNKANAGQEVAAFDSMLAQNEHSDRSVGFSKLPSSMQRMLSHSAIKDHPEAVFDGISEGIIEYKRRNGGEEPSAYVVAAALATAAMPFGGAQEYDSTVEPTFDSLSLGHHEPLSVVPAATQVVITYGIANSLPLVSMLPNPMGSNELPIVFGTAVAGMDMGVMREGDAMDGDKAGMPYTENRHILTMDKGAAGAFSLTSHVAYDAKVKSDSTTQFIVDTSSKKAPFLGGRVSIFIKGIKIASDESRNHPNNKGVSTLQPIDKIKVGTDTYIITSATADLDTHEINVQFDVAAGSEPDAGDVTVEIFFDYERKANGVQILTEPSIDMEFGHRSIHAFPNRSRSVATIDAITQLMNELGLSWFGAVQTIAMQKQYFEQTGRLLRTAINMCLANQDPETGRVVTFNFTKGGVSPINIADAFANINITLGMARTRLSTAINLAVGGYDLYVSDRGQAFFSGLSGENYDPTGESAGDQTSIYRIGKLKTSGANVYYVPKSMGVFNETGASTTAHALLVPRAISPAQAPFVGMVAVPPMVMTSNGNAYEKDVAIYSRTAAETNPIPRFANQFMLIEMINLPAL
ncbi:hypothetical protein [Psychrobacter celer]|uniref:hypothetical protein n=1 Tax=Psychrobacter celer TaxID=306572 RepID=UPI003FCF565A